MSHNRISVAALVLSFFAASAYAAPVPVTTCGQTVTEGVLTGDLDCSAASGFAVTLADAGSLDLAGYRLTGTSDSLNNEPPVYGGGVHCLGECTVTGGGGAIVGPPGAPEQSWYSFGIYSDPFLRGSRVHLSDTTISGWSTYGVQARSADVGNCQFTDNRYGLVVDRDATIVGCTFTGNDEGAHFLTADISNTSFDGNETGFYVLKKAKLTSSSASNNQDRGCFGLKVRAEDSVFENNCLTPSVRCADLVVRRHPRLINTPCATSLNDMTNSDWNVCSQD